MSNHKARIENRVFKLLGDRAYHQKNRSILKERIVKLTRFIEDNEFENIEIVINNNWSYPPSKYTNKNFSRIGGVCFAYQLWAVIGEAK